MQCALLHSLVKIFFKPGNIRIQTNWSLKYDFYNKIYFEAQYRNMFQTTSVSKGH